MWQLVREHLPPLDQVCCEEMAVKARVAIKAIDDVLPEPADSIA
jgi:hypothetical protein